MTLDWHGLPPFVVFKPEPLPWDNFPKVLTGIMVSEEIPMSASGIELQERLSREDVERISALDRDQRTAVEDRQMVRFYLEILQRQPPPVPLFPVPPVPHLLRRATAILDEDFWTRLRQGFYE